MSDLHCSGCGHRFGRRSSPLVLFGTFTLCHDCADSIEVHRRLFVGCREAHSARAHGGDVATLGRARQLLTPQGRTITT